MVLLLLEEGVDSGLDLDILRSHLVQGLHLSSRRWVEFGDLVVLVAELHMGGLGALYLVMLERVTAALVEQRRAQMESGALL